MTVTTVPSTKLDPAGLLLTDPEPFVLRTSLQAVLKVAVTCASEFTLNVHVELVPTHGPPHPLKTPFAPLAVSVTGEPAFTVIVQAPGQRIVLVESDT